MSCCRFLFVHARVDSTVWIVVLGAVLGTFFGLSSTCVGQVIYQNNFDQYPSTRRYKERDLANDWNDPEWSKGVKQGRVKIRHGYRAYGKSGSCLEIKSPKKSYGSSKSGATWQMHFDQSYEEVILTYHVKFKKGFDFVKGGKLPGLAGGTAPTGWTPATGYNGWTTRMMWRTFHTGYPGKPKQKTANMISYSKFVGSGYDGKGKIEDETYFTDNQNDLVTIKSNVWYEVTQRIRMNDPWANNGVIQIWLDDRLVVNQHDIRFRKTGAIGIDQLYFSMFFGGGSSWKTVKYATMYVDNFTIFAVE